MQPEFDGDTKHTTTVRFDGFDLDPRLLRGISDSGFTHCTPIQAAALPPALEGRDVVGQARTGTGKTAAFLIAALNRELRRRAANGEHAESSAPAADGQESARAQNSTNPRARPRILIIAPTRELALQIHSDALTLTKPTGLRAGVVYGGAGYREQQDMLGAGVDVLIGTPGRLIDFFKQHMISLRHIDTMVLDEADRMFDLGFIKDIRFIFRRLPAPGERMTMLFSATISHRVMELAYEHMSQPVSLDVTDERRTVREVSQRLYHVAKDEKFRLLVGLLHAEKPSRVLIFCNTKRVAELLGRSLEEYGWTAAYLSGDIPQRKRIQVLARFAAGDLQVMVATDVAARGLHIPEVSHVFNYDLPQDAPDYVHRIGRTARAGESGTAISFACEEYVFTLEAIEEYIDQQIPAEVASEDLLASAEFELIRSRHRKPRPARGGDKAEGDRRRPRRRPRRRRSENDASAGAPARPAADTASTT